MVEHWSEKPGVDSSILSLGISSFFVAMFFRLRRLCKEASFFMPKQLPPITHIFIAYWPEKDIYFNGVYEI